MPVFDKLEADLAKALMSLPATKGFEIGSGFSGTYLKGSEHNDTFIKSADIRKLRTISHNSGGIQGEKVFAIPGITNLRACGKITKICMFQ